MQIIWSSTNKMKNLLRIVWEFSPPPGRPRIELGHKTKTKLKIYFGEKNTAGKQWFHKSQQNFRFSQNFLPLRRRVMDYVGNFLSVHITFFKIFENFLLLCSFSNSSRDNACYFHLKPNSSNSIGLFSYIVKIFICTPIQLIILRKTN
jgi:hypothetical protein